MHSSISSSELGLSRAFEVVQGGKARRAIWAVLVGLVVIALAAELMTVLGVHRVSKILRRTVEEYHDAEKLRAFSSRGKPTMLLFGNSLLLEGVDYPSLRDSLAENYDVHRLVFEQTEYLEQYYVLRALLRGGARPHDVLLCTSVSHLLENDLRGEFMSRYMDATDIASLGRRRHLDATTLSGMMFAHWSEWYAFRAETRKAVLGASMPRVRDLATTLAWRPAHWNTAQEVRTKTQPRLLELKALCDQYGVRLTVLVMPSLWEDHSDVLVSIGEANEIPVLVPETPGAMDRSMFRDGLHLNSAGATIFTAKLPSALSSLNR